jgi:hypothetical protein
MFTICSDSSSAILRKSDRQQAVSKRVSLRAMAREKSGEACTASRRSVDLVRRRLRLRAKTAPCRLDRLSYSHAES